MVSAIPGVERCRGTYLYDWPLEDAEVGGLCLHRILRNQSGRSLCDGGLEHFRAPDSGDRHRDCLFTLIQDAMNSTIHEAA